MSEVSEVTDAYRESIEQAHAARVARLRSATGWLSLVGKAFLSRGSTVVGSASDAGARLPQGAPSIVGTIRIEEEDDNSAHRVLFRPAEGVAIRCDDQLVVDERVLRSDREGKADALIVDGFVLEVMERGIGTAATFALRIRDTREVPRPYGGIDSYPIDPSWNVRAVLEPHEGEEGGLRTVDLDFEGATGAIADTFVSPGTVIFEREGKKHSLEAVFEDSSRRRLFILFRDDTSGSESYGSGRFVYAPLPSDRTRELTIDFNLALLPGCAFTTFATCPIPPRENRLPIPVRAGEREYLGTPIGSEPRHP